MPSMRDLKAQDLQGLSPEAVTALATQMLEQLQQQAHELDSQHRELQSKGRELELKQRLIERKDRDIAWRDAKIEKITFELARLKRWKFGAKSEAMTADQRQMFQGHAPGGRGRPRGATRRAASCAAQGAGEAQGSSSSPAPPSAAGSSAPRRAPPRARGHHLRDGRLRGQPMTRVGEDISERLDIVPAEFFVHRISTESGAAAAANAEGSSTWCRSRPIRRSSTAASPPVGWWRTR